MKDDAEIEGNDLNSLGNMNTMNGSQISNGGTNQRLDIVQEALVQSIFVLYQNRRGLVEIEVSQDLIQS